MKLTKDELKICNTFGKKDDNNVVHCFECPLVLDKRYCLCKRNATRKEWEEYKI